jgi:hypothetical protein
MELDRVCRNTGLSVRDIEEADPGDRRARADREVCEMPKTQTWSRALL